MREDRFDAERGYAVATCQDCLTEIRLASWRGVRFFIEPDDLGGVFTFAGALPNGVMRIAVLSKKGTHSSHFAFCSQTRHRRPRAGEAPFRKSAAVAARVVTP